MSNDQADLAQWREYLLFDPDLEPWVHELSSLLDVQERLAAAVNYIQALDPNDDDDKKLGVSIGALALAYVDGVYDHIGVAHEPLAHTPRNIALALIALRNVLADAEEKVILKRMQLRPEDEQPEALPEAQPTPETPSTKRPKREETPDDDEANLLVKKYLASHPRATIREVSEATKISSGRISPLPAWRLEMAQREAAKPAPKKAERPLTDRMLTSIGKEDDPAAKILKDEAIWQWILENAKPKEKAELHMKNAEQRAKLIELSREMYDAEHGD